jgi:hypothetical protein
MHLSCCTAKALHKRSCNGTHQAQAGVLLHVLAPRVTQYFGGCHAWSSNSNVLHIAQYLHASAKPRVSRTSKLEGQWLPKQHDANIFIFSLQVYKGRDTARPRYHHKVNIGEPIVDMLSMLQ